MLKKGKKRAGDHGDHGDGDSVQPAKLAKTDADDGNGDIVVCELSNRRRVTVRCWQGKPAVDIREFYEKEGKELPGRKGILLPLDQWEILRDHIADISKALMEHA
ncbi:RNA polymerase II transcriptional coactivator KIWI-like [Phalaenopsis equestris]|uniref:RNA polymerase II transcriptional coactivator KIWI-like n=1 Tax=Phalaenopsis equestris TaxID=78828 RepID=UPI0009E28059|nr:RNA polymerase II transcriptional coactivator KIWI-like [Phalaenopsis equestris]